MLRTGTATITAGAFLAAITPHFIAAGWTNHDSPAANKIVFKTLGTSGLDTMYLLIDDTSNQYTVFTMSDTYNAGTKTLTNPTTQRYLSKSLIFDMPFWSYITLDYAIVVMKCNQTAAMYNGGYFGLLNRINPANRTAFISSGNFSPTLMASSDVVGFKALANLTSTAYILFKTPGGQYNQAMGGISLNAAFTANQFPNPENNGLMLSSIIIGNQSGYIFGELQNVYCCKGCNVASEDILEIGGNTFIVFVTGLEYIAIRRT
jgi:hypothetical protein